MEELCQITTIVVLPSMFRILKMLQKKKAPTDDSIRLYGEFLDKAHKAILDSFIIKGSFLEAVVEIVRNPLSQEKYILYKCILNNKEIYGDVLIDWYTTEDIYFKETIKNKVIQDITNKISLEILKEAYIQENKYL